VCVCVCVCEWKFFTNPTQKIQWWEVWT